METRSFSDLRARLFECFMKDNGCIYACRASHGQQEVLITLETSHLKRSNNRVGCKFIYNVESRSTTHKNFIVTAFIF